MEFLATLEKVSALFILILVGCLISKLKVTDRGFTRPLSNFLFYVSLPSLIISSMYFPFSPKLLVDSLRLILIGIAVMAGSTLLSAFLSRKLSDDYRARNVYEFSMIFSNFAFMGLPVTGAIFGQEGIFLASVFSVPIYVWVNSYGIMLMQRDSKGWRGIRLSNLLNPALIAIVVGFSLFVLSIELPEFIFSPLSMLGSTTTPLSMVLAGMLLVQAGWKDMFGNYKVYIVAFVRLIGFPLMVMLLAGFFVDDPLLVGVPVIITAMPVAANVSILSEKFGGESGLSARCVCITTFLSIITVPFISWLL